jgi:hypothetical protein
MRVPFRFLLPLALPLAGCAALPADAPAPAAATQAAADPRGAALAWSAEEVAEILARTQTIRLAPDIGHLSPGERIAIDRLIAVGRIFQDVYEHQRHRDALAVRAALAPDSPAATLYRLFQGPIGTNPDNVRAPFLAVEDAPPGKNVYPWDLTRAEYEAFLAAHPGRRAEITHLRSVVRRAEPAVLARDLATLRRHPVLDTLHPGLRGRLEALAAAPDRAMLYGLPYSVAYAEEMLRAHRLLNEAADAVETDDGEFARFLRNRARDLLSDDYESGDAAWITGRFRNLNAQIGAYETYDDELTGTRAFYSLNVLARRQQETDALRQALGGIQAVEDALPYARRKRVRDDIPVGVYDVVADFAQSRGGNTATILPNEAYLARRYGRTILLRANIMRSPEIFGAANAAWGAVVAAPFAGHLTNDANFHRTLWHEVGHYLGPDRTADGRDLDDALGADANLIEEMKADLVSLFAGPELLRRGYFDEAGLRSHYASGIWRTLQNNRPRRAQPYQTMQLMQFNWFLDRGVLRFDAGAGRLHIDYGRYHGAVEALLREVIALQERGDAAALDAFIARWTTWDEALHGRIAAALRAQQRYRYRLFTYAALGE